MVRSPKNSALAGKITDRQMDLIVRQIASLPIAPAVGKAMLHLTLRGDSASPSPEFQRQLLTLARLDPYLCAWLSGAIDSSTKPARKSSPRADGRFSRLQSLLLGANLRQLLEPAAPSRLDLAGFWRHSVATAVASREIAAHLALPVAPEEVFACGLLHDLGKLAMDAALPKSYARVLAADCSQSADIAHNEQELLGVDHMVFGRRLAAHWRLAAMVESVIWLHHQDPAGLPESLPDRQVVAAVGLADAVARKAGVGFSGNFTYAQPLESWAKAIGCADEFVHRLLDELPGLVAKELAAVESELSRAPARIGQAVAEHISQRDLQLTDRTSILTGKAQAMDLMSEFLAGIANETSVAGVLAQIAKTATAALEHEPTASEPIVAYSLESSDQTFATACRFEGRDSFTWQTLACSAEMLPGKDGLADVLDLGAYLDEPIMSGGNWIGGVLVPAGALDRTDANWAQLLSAFGMAISIMQAKAAATRMNEELSSASRVLAATGRAASEAQTVAAIGQMAAGAAHELNNPLAVISGRAQLMASKASTPEEKKVWTTMVEQAQRISDIITDLMNFASPPRPAPEATDVRAMLESAARSVGGANKDGSPKVDIEVDSSVPKAYVDQSQMDAVLREILTNATLAGGAGVHIRMSAAPEGQDLLITVADDGPGMDDRTLARAFTPFYSDQPAGRRRGLGLARVRRWVEINGGSVQITSRSGAGTRVMIRIPAAKE